MSGDLVLLSYFESNYIFTQFQTWICGPDAVIKDRDKWLHPTYTVGCNYLSLPLIPASGTQVLSWTTKIKRYPCSRLSKLLCPSYRTDFNTAVLDTATADVCRLLSSPPYSGLKQDPCTFRATFSVIITWENMKLNSGGTAVSRVRRLIN